jgi:hypothetical protein
MMKLLLAMGRELSGTQNSVHRAENQMVPIERSTVIRSRSICRQGSPRKAFLRDLSI